MGSRQTGKLAEFEKFAATAKNGVQVSVVPLPEPLDLGEETAGVVLFDDGKLSAASWIASVREQTRYLSVPVIAVANRNDREFQSRLLAAGACAVCDNTCSNEHILGEIQNHCNSEPVIAEIRTGLLGPFTTATTLTIREMACVEATVKSVYQKRKHKMFGDISAVIGLMARTEGAMVISFPELSALAVTRRILAGLNDNPSPDDVRDCIGEVANVIAGQARGILASTPYAFGMSTPTIVSGAGHEIRHKPGMPCLVVAFCSELGDFALQLCLGI
jgi:chemotaxis protein CheX